MNTIDRIPKPSKITETIAGEIRRLIELGKLAPGERLPSEKELSEAFGVGRSSVREALQALEHLGLIQSRQGIGRFLSPDAQALCSSLNWNMVLEHAPVFELMEAREHLEALAAGLAARRASDEDIATLEAMLKGMEGITDLDAWFRADMAFHLAISKTCKNSVISELVNQLMHRVYGEAERFARTAPDTAAASMRLFNGVLAAIKDGDGDGAAALMKEHLQSVRVSLAKQE